MRVFIQDVIIICESESDRSSSSSCCCSSSCSRVVDVLCVCIYSGCANHL